MKSKDPDLGGRRDPPFWRLAGSGRETAPVTLDPEEKSVTNTPKAQGHASSPAGGGADRPRGWLQPEALQRGLGGCIPGMSWSLNAGKMGGFVQFLQEESHHPYHSKQHLNTKRESVGFNSCKGRMKECQDGNLL